MMGRVVRVSPGGHQGIVVRGRLDLQHVDSRTCKLPRGDRLRHRVGVDDRTPGGVDQVRRPRHFGDGRRVEHVTGFLGQWAVNAYDQRLGQQLGERLNSSDTERLVVAVLLVGVVEDDVHPQGLCPERRGRTDSAEPHHAEDLSPQPGKRHYLLIRPVALACPQSGIGEVHAPGERKRHGDSRVGDLLGAVVGHVGHGDSPGAGELPIDVVDSNAAANDQLAASEPLDRGLCDGDLVVQNDRVGIVDRSCQIGLAVGLQRDHVGNVAEKSSLGFELVVDEVGNHYTKLFAHRRDVLWRVIWCTTGGCRRTNPQEHPGYAPGRQLQGTGRRPNSPRDRSARS